MRALIPPPHGLSRGNAHLSSSTVEIPVSPSTRAAVAPAGPPPTTITSYVTSLDSPDVGNSPCVFDHSSAAWPPRFLATNRGARICAQCHLVSSLLGLDRLWDRAMPCQRTPRARAY